MIAKMTTDGLIKSSVVDNSPCIQLFCLSKNNQIQHVLKRLEVRLHWNNNWKHNTNILLIVLRILAGNVARAQFAWFNNIMCTYSDDNKRLNRINTTRVTDC